MFVGRDNELSALQILYDRNAFQFAVIYGRRRVGKTTLVSEFIKDKPAIYFSAQEASEHMNLQVFSDKVYAFFSLPKFTGAFANWNAAFSFIADQAERQRFVLAIDEFPYIAESNKGLASILQNIIDHRLRHTGLFLVLCGSHIGFMESEVLGYKSPLFGRRTTQLKIEGFDYAEAAKMLVHDAITREDIINYYACLGGTPHYLAQVELGKPFYENIRNLFFNPQGYLYTEPIMLLQQELREPAMYNSILTAIATGSSRLNEIATKAGEPTSKTIKYIKTLTDLTLLHRVHPFGDNPERSRKSLYAISDNCFRFWYRFVFMNRGAIDVGMGDYIIDNLVAPYLSSYIGKPVFEEVCKQYLIRTNKKGCLPFTALRFDPWWGQDTSARTQTDIDIVADNSHEKRVLLCECKWTSTPPGVKEVNNLLNKVHLFPGYSEYYFMFFSKQPFGHEALNIRKNNKNLTLLSLDDLF
jgi:hypothetical protein